MAVLTKAPPKVAVPKNPGYAGAGVDAGLAPAGPGQLRSIIKLLTSAQGNAPSAFQATPYSTLTQRAGDTVRSQIDPLVQNVGSEATSRAKAIADEISGITKSAALDLGNVAPQIGQGYDEVIGQAGRAGDALTSFLKDSGSREGSSLEQALSLADAGPGTPAGQMGQAATVGLSGNAAGISGANSLSFLDRLLADKAADVSYARKMPAVATSTGLQQIGKSTAAINNDAASQIKALEAEAPGLIQQILGDLTKTELSKAEDLSKFRGDRASMLAEVLSHFSDNELQKAIARTDVGKANAAGAASSDQFWAGLAADAAKTNATLTQNQDLSGLKSGSAAGVKQSAIAAISSRFAKPVAVTQSKPDGVYTTGPNKGKPYYTNPKNGFRSPTPFKTTGKLPYQQAFRQAAALVGAELQAAGYTTQEILQIVNQGLAAAGITPPADQQAAGSGPDLNKIVGGFQP